MITQSPIVSFIIGKPFNKNCASNFCGRRFLKKFSCQIFYGSGVFEIDVEMMKFRVTDHSGSLNESQSTTSSTVNLTSKFMKSNKGRRNSLVVEDTGRLTSRRCSVPCDSFISIADFK